MAKPTFFKVLVCSLVVLSDVSVFGQEEPSARTDPVKINSNTNVIGLEYSNYDAFYGIPFSEPPVGNLRFANPVRKSLPNGDFLAVNISEPCVQPNGEGSEDCLYLNIYRPNTDRSREDFPILFYVHGGSYTSGSAHPNFVGPSYFMDNGSVILVSIQYRLNTLGFLATGDPTSPGNYGLKDQALALIWVKENIKAFGGDPDSITIMGHSAGSGSVHFLMMSPLSKHLIKSVIAISGSAIAPWNYATEDPLELARHHARIFNVTNADQLNSTQLVEKLREVPAKDLILSVPKLKLFGVDPLTLYRPVVEPMNSPDAFLTETPYEIMKRGGMAKVPTMFGLVPNEGSVRALSLIYNETQREEFNRKMDEIIPFILELKLKGKAARDFTRKIQRRYNLTSGIADMESELGVQQLVTDRFFYYPAYRTLQFHLLNPSSVYFYRFAYRGQHSLSDLNILFEGRDFDVVHGDDFLYLFDPRVILPDGLKGEDKVASNEYVKFIVQFVVDQTTTQGNVKCTEMEPMCSYVEFNKSSNADLETTIRQDFDMEMVQFWDKTGEIPF